MPLRFICPCCHSPIDPLTMDIAKGRENQFRICPECDAPLLVLLPPPETPAFVHGAPR